MTEHAAHTFSKGLGRISGRAGAAVCAGALVFGIGAGLAPASALAAESGTTASKPTLAELREAWWSIPDEPSSSAMFSTQPDTSSYTAGVYSDAAKRFASSYLDFIRTQAGLEPVALDDALNESAAQGALLMAKTNTFGHSIADSAITAAGITAAQAKPGRYALATSNISASYGYSKFLKVAIQGLMDDSDAGNIVSVGHRRWLLDPATSTMGIGSALGTSWKYTDVRVFNSRYSAYYDSSYPSVAQQNPADAQFVAWPASGAMLNDVFSTRTPWSVSLDPDVYGLGQTDASSVTVTVSHDGETWTFDSNDTSTSTDGEYFGVSKASVSSTSTSNIIGDGDCIIFRPSLAEAGSSYTGSYKVKITGLPTAKGASSTLEYTVDFASSKVDLGDAQVAVGDGSALVYNGSAQKPAVTVSYDGQALSEGADYTLSYANNTNAGTATVTVAAASGSKYCTGSATRSFAIGPKELPAGAISAIPDQEHTGSAVEPALSVKDGESTLVRGVDYAVSFADNVEKGTATATVTGTGNYTGVSEASFQIVEPGTQGEAGATSGNGSTAAAPTGGSTAAAPTGDGSTMTPSSRVTAFTVKNSAGSFSYRVTGVGTVTLVRAVAKNGASVTLDTVACQGVSYKVTTIGEGAFKSSKAKKVTLGANVKTVCKNAFAKASTSVLVIGKNVSAIGSRAFKGAKKLKTIMVKSTKLTGKSIKGSLKGSKVKAVKVKVGSKKLNKKYVKKYKKTFAKKTSGKSVKVK